MIVKCTANNVNVLPERIRKYAFTQDNEGQVDLTLNLEYQVYGLRDNKDGKFYLVLTDSVHADLPWWMPADLFEELDSNIPSDWIERSWGIIGKDKIKSSLRRICYILTIVPDQMI